MVRIGTQGDMCTFCAVADGSASGVENQPLLRVGSVTLIPALGPLAAGHVLAISSRHHLSFARADLDERQSLVEMVERIATRLGPLLLVEHGMTPTSNAGGCIDHAHMNILPLDQIPNTFSIGRPVRGTSTIADLAAWADEPYVLVGTSLDPVLTIHSALDLPSQYFRRRMARARGLEEWDWALHTGNSLLEETIRLVRN